MVISLEDLGWEVFGFLKFWLRVSFNLGIRFRIFKLIFFGFMIFCFINMFFFG